jgi:CMP-N-acetylneuraminic acid synthetase
VPELRPSFLSTDDASLIDVISYHINKLSHLPDYVMLLQPTSPLRKACHIDEAISLLDGHDAVVSVTRTCKPSAWTTTLDKNRNLSHLFDSARINRQSQEYPDEYTLNGAIYIAETNRLLNEQTFLLSSNCRAYEMSSDASVDIDTELDLLIAKAMFLGIKPTLDLLDNAMESKFFEQK